MQHRNRSVSDEEISLFDSLAHNWWDPQGPMRILHQMNPLRINWACDVLQRAQISKKHAHILDIGCGAGIATESLARKGYRVTGIDVSKEALDVARDHARLSFSQTTTPHQIDYREVSAEQLVSLGERFDAITAFELIEHTNDPQEYMHILSALLKPGAPLILSTMNRTIPSLLVAKIGAEYVLNLVPKGTHHFKKFIKPVELACFGRQSGIRFDSEAGMIYRPSGWKLSKDMSINYMMSFIKL